jgi:prepilin-type N-terminal cleavage/methylation domain-containing protein
MATSSLHSKRPAGRRAFTLVELLVVITIIGMLMSLLLPAVQSARESARSVQCANNVKQLALGSLDHVNNMGFFPSGGWGYFWAGDPDRGAGMKQPGGWVYSVLPYMDQKNLWAVGAGLSATLKPAAMLPQLTTPLSFLYCPSRRPVTLYTCSTTSLTSPTDLRNISYPSSVSTYPNVSRTDYAMNAGDQGFDQLTAGPTTLAQGDTWALSPCSSSMWPCTNGQSGGVKLDGVSFLRSQITLGHFAAKGASNTYLLGDKYLDPDNYFSGADLGDNEWAMVGFDDDIYRDASMPPMQDTRGYTNVANTSTSASLVSPWGSAHPTAIHMAFCDGSVHEISYGIDLTTHQNLANRTSTAAIDPTKIQ